MENLLFAILFPTAIAIGLEIEYTLWKRAQAQKGNA